MSPEGLSHFRIIRNVQNMSNFFLFKSIILTIKRKSLAVTVTRLGLRVKARPGPSTGRGLSLSLWHGTFFFISVTNQKHFTSNNVGQIKTAIAFDLSGLCIYEIIIIMLLHLLSND
jgi:hypothetical protein